MKNRTRWLTVSVLTCFIGSGTAGVEPLGPRVAAAPAQPTSTQLIFSADEQRLFADIKAGRFATVSFAEAALIGSGVADVTQRQTYLRRLMALETQAAGAVGSNTSPQEKAQRLLSWLFSEAGPLAPVPPRKRPKYVATQTSLAVLLDSGTYNCVSATVVYNVLGRRLGLNLRAIEVPTHVFSVLLDGEQRVDVETTTPRGFNPVRDKAALQEFQELTGFTYIPARSRKKQREVDDAALVGAIFYNRGVDALRAKRHAEAFRNSVLALRLDPASTQAAGNAEAALARWAADAAREGQVDLALQIIGQNLGLLKDRSAETKIVLIAYQERAQQLSKNGDVAGVADLYVAARQRHAQDEQLAGRLERAALAAYDQWAMPLKRERRWREAIAIYQRGLKAWPDNPHLQRQLKFCEKQVQAPAPQDP